MTKKEAVKKEKDPPKQRMFSPPNRLAKHKSTENPETKASKNFFEKRAKTTRQSLDARFRQSSDSKTLTRSHARSPFKLGLCSRLEQQNFQENHNLTADNRTTLNRGLSMGLFLPFKLTPAKEVSPDVVDEDYIPDEREVRALVLNKRVSSPIEKRNFTNEATILDTSFGHPDESPTPEKLMRKPSIKTEKPNNSIIKSANHSRKSSQKSTEILIKQTQVILSQ